jgi:hypothetical protein
MKLHELMSLEKSLKSTQIKVNRLLQKYRLGENLKELQQIEEINNNLDANFNILENIKKEKKFHSITVDEFLIKFKEENPDFEFNKFSYKITPNLVFKIYTPLTLLIPKNHPRQRDLGIFWGYNVGEYFTDSRTEIKDNIKELIMKKFNGYIRYSGFYNIGPNPIQYDEKLFVGAEFEFKINKKVIEENILSEVFIDFLTEFCTFIQERNKMN